MPNRNSSAGHIPLRTCVVCRKKTDQQQLLSFFVMPEGLVFDILRQLQQRKFYLCTHPQCLEDLAKWRKRHHKRTEANSR